MADLEVFRKMIRRYYRQTYREDGKTKYQQQDLADMIVMNEDELGKRLNGYRDEKTGRAWRLTEENVLDIVLVLSTIRYSIPVCNAHNQHLTDSRLVLSRSCSRMRCSR
jgi:hypothetical protein